MGGLVGRPREGGRGAVNVLMLVDWILDWIGDWEGNWEGNWAAGSWISRETRI